VSLALVSVALCALTAGCKSPAEHRAEADTVAAEIIAEKQQEALGRTEPFTIDRPEDTLRRRLMEAQALVVTGTESLGTSMLEEPPDWPEPSDGEATKEASAPACDLPLPLKLSLFEALEVAASNSRDYQSRKEDVFRTALALDLERDEFRSTFSGRADAVFTTDLSDGDPTNSVESSHSVDWSKLFENGVSVTAGLALDLVKLLTDDRESSLGIVADGTLSIPLLRGAGRRIVTEPLTQAERNVVYAIHTFERFKRTFVVSVASAYLDVLQRRDQVKNAKTNYRSLISSARRARHLADAGRLSGIQVDQAYQDELRARDRWVSAIESYERSLDSFKVTLGLPADAEIELDPDELDRLATAAKAAIGDIDDLEKDIAPPADEWQEEEEIELREPTREGGGPYEVEENIAVRIALENRLDLRTTLGRLYDAQRKVIVSANALEAGLDIEAGGRFGEGRSSGSADQPNAELRPERGVYSIGLFADLPWERTAERNAYRGSIINFERAARDLQQAEDQIKLDIRSALRNLIRAREAIKIQSLAVEVARTRVDSVRLFLQAGRSEIRDLLEAQESLVSAQDALTANLVDYRVAVLALQRDMGVLEVNEKGLWREYDPQNFQQGQ
jgi:outer membrane protein TolC